MATGPGPGGCVVTTPDGGPRPTVPGPVLFARYAYPPNELGYCGPADAGELLEASAARDVAALSHLATRFDGAWPYLELIAGANGIADPLDTRVVEAYWVGNDLLDHVGSRLFATAVDARFAGRAGPSVDAIAGAASLGGVAHHSFHVFAVSPWVGMLRAGRTVAPLEVLDRCRVRWGVVEGVDGDEVSVRSRGLAFDGTRLTLGVPRPEVARRSSEGVGGLPDLRPGDVVSLHWDWVCDRLSPGALARLQVATVRNLAVVNSQSRPGPAVAADARG